MVVKTVKPVFFQIYDIPSAVCGTARLRYRIMCGTARFLGHDGDGEPFSENGHTADGMRYDGDGMFAVPHTSLIAI